MINVEKEKRFIQILNNKLNQDKFADLRVQVSEFENKIQSEKLKTVFHNCFFNTIDTTTYFEEDGSVYIITGDIPAMWLRDSSVQVMQYLFFAKQCPSVREYIKGVLTKQFAFILLDPYANAFNREANGKGHITDLDPQHPHVWERKFELDSLCYPLYLAVKYFESTKDKACFENGFLEAFDKCIEIFKIEQNHANNSKYYHENVGEDKKYWVGHGDPVANNGLVWSGYRPSDDKCSYGYYLPGNMFIVSVLTKLISIFKEDLQDETRSNICKNLSQEIQEALDKYAIVKDEDGNKIYALETDGLGNYNMMDDANVPNLLSMPYYEYPYIDKNAYNRTRLRLLSKENPYYFEGKVLKGIGSPHTPKEFVWPLSIIMQALTSDSKDEINECVEMLLHSTNGTNYMHESVHKDDESRYSRPWFAWANSLFSYMILLKQDCIKGIEIV